MEKGTDRANCKSSATFATSWLIVAVIVAAMLHGFADAADRIHAVSPFGSAEVASPAHWADQLAADGSAWRTHMDLWRQFARSPSDDAIRGSLQLPPTDAPVAASLPPRRPVPALAWRAGSYQHLQTRHFNLLSRADRDQSETVAEDLERVWAVWTQVYFPLWAGRNGDGRATRHTVVLLPDARRYAMTLTSPRIAAGDRRTIAASTGFYSDPLRMSFFYPQSDPDARRHELVHQLFAEATAGDRRGQPAAGDDFWLLEGVAGHFESLATVGNLASLGGWDSPRLQYARYAAMIAGTPIDDVTQLRGNRSEVQRLGDPAVWYRDAITRVHALAHGPDESRIWLLDRLATIYGVPDWRSAAGLGEPAGKPVDQDLRAFLSVQDTQLSDPTTQTRPAICLAGMPLSAAGLASLRTGRPLRWLDVSRLPADDAMVARWLRGSPAVEQLSLEATLITSAIGPAIAATGPLRSLDVSWTAVGDDFTTSLTPLRQLDTLYLTGTAITDSSVPTLAGLTQLTTLDVQRTGITDAGTARLARPGLTLNPLAPP